MQQFAAQGDHLWTRLEIWIYFEFQAVLSELEWTSVGFNEPQRSLSQWVSGAENLWGFNLRLQLEASTFRRQVKELNKVHLFCETLTLLFQLKRRWSLLVCGQRALKELPERTYIVGYPTAYSCSISWPFRLPSRKVTSSRHSTPPSSQNLQQSFCSLTN